MSDASPPLAHLFLGRQPILDGRRMLVGYEFLFRDSPENRAPEINPGLATADVVCKAFADLGLIGALDGHRAFVIADPEFLAHEAIEALPADAVVLQLDAHLATLAPVAERCQALASRGYSFCLTCRQTEWPALDAALLDRFSFIKLNIGALPDASLRALLALADTHHLVTIASHVETQEAHQRASELDFQLFQGYYFAEPILISGRKLDPSLQGLMRIITLINQDADLSVVEPALKAEAALTLKLLRLTNSVGVGLRTRVGSVRQAIALLGRRQLLRWLQLLLFSHAGANGFERNPLMQYAALKGSFMERLARHGYPGQGVLADQAFLAGLLSLLPAAVGLPMEDILDQLAVVPQLRSALLARTGELGLLLALTESYDAGDLGAVDRHLAGFGQRIDRASLNRCLAESIAWIQELSAEQG